MAERKPARKGKQESAKGASVSGKAAKFTDEELGAMKQRVRELKAAADKVDGEQDVLAKIATMAAPDRATAPAARCPTSNRRETVAGP